jgi:hypothetical protein
VFAYRFQIYITASQGTGGNHENIPITLHVITFQKTINLTGRMGKVKFFRFFNKDFMLNKYPMKCLEILE